MLYDMIESDMTSYKSGYYQLFKEEYQKEYGSSYPESSTISKKDMFYKCNIINEYLCIYIYTL